MNIVPITPIDVTGDWDVKKVLSQGQNPKVFQSFEEVFLSKMFSGMILNSPWKKGSGSSELQNEWSWNLMADAIAKEVAAGGQLGLAKQIADSMANSEKGAAAGTLEKKNIQI